MLGRERGIPGIPVSRQAIHYRSTISFDQGPSIRYDHTEGEGSRPRSSHSGKGDCMKGKGKDERSLTSQFGEHQHGSGRSDKSQNLYQHQSVSLLHC